MPKLAERSVVCAGGPVTIFALAAWVICTSRPTLIDRDPAVTRSVRLSLPMKLRAGTYTSRPSEMAACPCSGCVCTSTVGWRPGEQTIGREALASALNALTTGDKEARIFLRADQEVAYGALMEVMNLMRKAGYLKIALVGLEKPPPQ